MEQATWGQLCVPSSYPRTQVDYGAPLPFALWQRCECLVHNQATARLDLEKDCTLIAQLDRQAGALGR